MKARRLVHNQVPFATNNRNVADAPSFGFLGKPV